MIPMGLSSKYDSFLSSTTFPLCVHFLCVGAIPYHAHTSCTRRCIRNVTHHGNVFPMVLGSYSLCEAISCVYIYLVIILVIGGKSVSQLHMYLLSIITLGFEDLQNLNTTQTIPCCYVGLNTLYHNVQVYTVQCLYFMGLNFRDFCEFNAIHENISTKILTLRTIACFYSVFTNLFNEN